MECASSGLELDASTIEPAPRLNHASAEFSDSDHQTGTPDRESPPTIGRSVRPGHRYSLPLSEPIASLGIDLNPRETCHNLFQFHPITRQHFFEWGRGLWVRGVAGREGCGDKKDGKDSAYHGSPGERVARGE